jgi:hypothetical protein
LRGVYTPAYSTIFVNPRHETVGLTPKYSAATPVAPEKMAKKRALRPDIRRRTSGLFLVLLILASVDGSYSMLSALALPEHRAVPMVRKVSVSGLRLGVSVMLGVSISGTG